LRPTTSAPTKIVLELQAAAGDAASVESWIRDALATAERTGALQGSSVLTEGGRYFVLLRFATEADHDRWRASPEVADLMRRGEAFVGREPPITRTGLETWFALPGTSAAAPPKWKMALVTFCALLPQIVGLAVILPKSFHFVVNIAVTTAITVSMLTWVLMPRLTRILAPWLYSKEAPR
jgi:uncharacterized protein